MISRAEALTTMPAPLTMAAMPVTVPYEYQQQQQQQQQDAFGDTSPAADRASRRYLKSRSGSNSGPNGSSASQPAASTNGDSQQQHQQQRSQNEYYARDYVTGLRARRPPTAMANADNSDLDPLWQNLEWYVNSYVLRNTFKPCFP